MTDTGAAGDAGRPDPRALATAGEFVEALRRLKRWSGLGYRQLAKRATATGHALPRSTLTVALNRGTLPREDLVAAFVRTCGCDDAEVAAWVAARRRIAAGAGGNGSAARWLGHRRGPAGAGSAQAAGGDEDAHEHAETLELINAELGQRQAGVTAAATAVQARSVLLIGFAAAAAQFLATRAGAPGLQRAAFAGYAVSAACGVAALAVRPAAAAPAADVLVEDLAHQSRAEALARLAAARVALLRADTGRQRRRTGLWWAAVASLAVATVLAIVAIRQAVP